MKHIFYNTICHSCFDWCPLFLLILLSKSLPRPRSTTLTRNVAVSVWLALIARHSIATALLVSSLLILFLKPACTSTAKVVMFVGKTSRKNAKEHTKGVGRILQASVPAWDGTPRWQGNVTTLFDFCILITSTHCCGHIINICYLLYTLLRSFDRYIQRLNEVFFFKTLGKNNNIDFCIL